MDFCSGEDIMSSSMADNVSVNSNSQLAYDYVSDQGRNQNNFSEEEEEEEKFSWTDENEEFQISYSGRPLSDDIPADDISQLTYDNVSDQNSLSKEVKLSSAYDTTYIEWFKFLYPDRPVIDGIPADDMLELNEVTYDTTYIEWFKFLYPDRPVVDGIPADDMLELYDPEVTGASSNSESETTEASTRKRKKPTHPPTSEMVLESIRNLKKPEGASSIAIRRYMEDNYEIDMKVIRTHLNKFLKTAVEKGTLELVSGVGARGVYKIKNEELTCKRKKAKLSTDSRRKKEKKKPKKKKGHD